MEGSLEGDLAPRPRPVATRCCGGRSNWVRRTHYAWSQQREQTFNLALDRTTGVRVAASAAFIVAVVA